MNLVFRTIKNVYTVIICEIYRKKNKIGVCILKQIKMIGVEKVKELSWLFFGLLF